jgi:hypothetical protein
VGSQPSNQVVARDGSRCSRCAHAQKAELEKQCREMLLQGTTRPPTSAFSAPVLLVKKGEGSWHLCVSYHCLNKVTIRGKFPIPAVEEMLDKFMRGVEYFTKLDLRASYHQVHMSMEDIKKTVFRTHEGMFGFMVRPFGRSYVPSKFQPMMNEILKPLLRRFVLVFFDDILIYNPSLSEHLRHVHLVLAKL